MNSDANPRMMLADLIHNVGDAATAIPLGAAFLLRSPRAERTAGLFVVAAIFVFACVAGYEAIVRLIDPHDPTALGALAATGAIGFAGNLDRALIRTRAGHRLARPRADALRRPRRHRQRRRRPHRHPHRRPLIGLAITLVILRVTWQSWRTVRDDGHH